MAFTDIIGDEDKTEGTSNDFLGSKTEKSVNACDTHAIQGVLEASSLLCDNIFKFMHPPKLEREQWHTTRNLGNKD